MSADLQRSTVGNALVPVTPATPARPAADPDAAGEMAVYAHALRRRWKLAACLGAVGLLVGAAAGWKATPLKSTVRTLLRVDAAPQTLVFNNMDGRSNFTYYQRTQLVMAKSRPVLNAALAQPGVAELPSVARQTDPVGWLEKELKVDYSLAPEILRISMAGPDAAETTALVNAVRDAYLRECVDKEHTERTVRLEKLQGLYKQYESVLTERRKVLDELARSAGARDTQSLAARQQFAGERLAETHKQLTQLQADLRKAKLEATAQEEAEKGGDSGVADAAVEEELKKDKAAEVLAARVTEYEQAYEQTHQRAARGDAEPAVRAQAEKLTAARDALKAHLDRARPAILESLREKKRSESRSAQAQTRARVKLLGELEGMLAADADRMERESRALNEKTIDIENIREDLKHAEDMARKVGTQAESLKVELQAPARVSLLEDAVVEDGGAKKKLMTAAGGGLGLMLLLVCAVAFLESRSGKIGTPDEVRRGLNLPLVGVLPAVPAGVNERLARGDAASCAARGRVLLDWADAARTLLQRAAVGDATRAVVITSATSGEGKSSLACHLAGSLARAGHRTLLIDGDLRRPSLQRVFGLPPGAGLADVLRGTADAAKAAQPAAAVDGLWVLPAGKVDAAAVRGLARLDGPAFYRGLKEQFDFVVVDTAPVLPVADALLLSAGADAVLVSLMRDVSRTPAVYAACERLSRVGAPVLGAVMTGVRGKVYETGYAYA